MAFFNAVILLGFYDVVSIRAVFHSINHPFYSIPCVLLFSHLVVSDSLLPYGLQPASLLCPSPSLRVCPSSCPLNRWCHPTISSCCPLLLLPSVFPSIMSWLFALGGQSIGVSASASNECSRLISFRIDRFDLLAVQGTLKSLLHHHSLKALILQCSAFFIVQLSHPYMEKS